MLTKGLIGIMETISIRGNGVKKNINVLPFLGKGKERDSASPLDGRGQGTLMGGTVTGDTSRDDFSTIGQKVSKILYILKVNLIYFIAAKTANLLPLKVLTFFQAFLQSFHDVSKT